MVLLCGAAQLAPLAPSNCSERSLISCTCSERAGKCMAPELLTQLAVRALVCGGCYEKANGSMDRGGHVWY